MSHALFGQPGATRDGADDMRLDLHRRRGGAGARQLRIEGAGDAIGALRGEVRGRVEQAKVARVVHVHHAVLQTLDRPVQEFVECARGGKIELRELAPERGPIERRHDAAAPDALARLVQRPRQPVVHPGAGVAVRETVPRAAPAGRGALMSRAWRRRAPDPGLR